MYNGDQLMHPYEKKNDLIRIYGRNGISACLKTHE